MDCSTPGFSVSLSPGVCSGSCPLSWWCYLTISSSATLFSFCFQSRPVLGSFLCIYIHPIGSLENPKDKGDQLFLVSILSFFRVKKPYSEALFSSATFREWVCHNWLRPIRINLRDLGKMCKCKQLFTGNCPQQGAPFLSLRQSCTVTHF